jgi:drug/metabolite transporter (DMT)-like permease
MNIKNNFLFLILVFLAMIIWAGSWVSGKVIDSYTSINLIVLWRFILTFIIFIPYIFLNRNCAILDLKKYFLIFLNALLFTGYTFVFFKGLVTGLPSIGGIIVTTLSPIFTFAIIKIFFREKVLLKHYAGLFLGFLCGIIILKIWKLNFNQLILSGNLYFLIGAVLWAFVTILGAKILKDLDIFIYSFYLYGFSVIIQMFVCYDVNIFSVFTLGKIFWFNMIYLGVVSSAFATSIYFIASKKIGANKSSSFMFIVPFWAVILSFIFLKEIPDKATIISGLFGMIAIYLINKK